MRTPVTHRRSRTVSHGASSIRALFTKDRAGRAPPVLRFPRERVYESSSKTFCGAGHRPGKNVFCFSEITASGDSPLQFDSFEEESIGETQLLSACALAAPYRALGPGGPCD